MANGSARLRHLGHWDWGRGEGAGMEQREDEGQGGCDQRLVAPPI